MTADFNDFKQDGRYIGKLDSTRLILALPVTTYRPEAMRVTGRRMADHQWFEVESYNERMNRWISQKDHDHKNDAINDALGRYSPGAGLRDMVDLHALWGVLGNIMATDDGEIDEPFLQFPKGAARDDIWHWFEAENQEFVVANELYNPNYDAISQS